jgi:hypothetical protein
MGWRCLVCETAVDASSDLLVLKILLLPLSLEILALRTNLLHRCITYMPDSIFDLESKASLAGWAFRTPCYDGCATDDAKCSAGWTFGIRQFSERLATLNTKASVK